MKCSEFILQKLVEDGYLEENVLEAFEISRVTLLEETELGDIEIDDYIYQYEEYCEDEGIEPVMDVE